MKKQTAAPIGELEGAELLVYGVVSEFEMKESGGGVDFGFSQLLMFGGGKSTAHMAIDLRTVDTGTGRIINATRVEGKASDYNVRVGTRH